MPTITILAGLLLIVVSGVGYTLSESHSLTAFIPAGIGILLIICGIIARNDSLRKHAMHAAAALALLAVIGSARGLTKLPTLLTGETVERPLAVVAQSMTALICALFVGLAIRSFIAARIARQAAEKNSGKQS